MDGWKYLKYRATHVIWQNPKSLLTSWQTAKEFTCSLESGYYHITRWLSTDVSDEQLRTLLSSVHHENASLLVEKLLRISRWRQLGIRPSMGPFSMQGPKQLFSLHAKEAGPDMTAREGPASGPWHGLGLIPHKHFNHCKSQSPTCAMGWRRIGARAAQTENSDVLLLGWFSSSYHEL